MANTDDADPDPDSSRRVPRPVAWWRRLSAERRRTVVAVLGVSLVVAVVRVYIYGFVFRNGDVVLLANDPYARLDTIRTVTATAHGLGEIPARVDDTHRYPLFIAVMSGLVELAGNEVTAAETLLAWYPVAVALIMGGLVYGVTRRITGTWWGGVIGGVAFAIMPSAVVRTALGYGDHHAFDYLWLALTVFTLLVLADTEARRRRVRLGASLALAIAVAAQALAWRGGVILLIPIGLYAQWQGIVAVRAGRSPSRELAYLLGALVVGAGLTLFGHRSMSWFSTGHALLPAVLCVGVAGVALAGEVARRAPAPLPTLVGLEGAGILLVAGHVISPLQQFLREGAAYQTKVSGWNVIEGLSLIGGGSLGPIAGPVSVFGLLAVIGLPALLLATWRLVRSDAPGMTVVVSYAWVLLAAALVQRRFAAALAVVLAPLVAIGLVSVATHLNVIVPRLTSSGSTVLELNSDVELTRILVLTGLVMLVVSASFVLIPIKMNGATYSTAEYTAAQSMEAHAVDNGWNRSANGVASPWSEFRMYNYHVYDEAPWYSFARREYPKMLASVSPAATYERYRTDVGFVVTTDQSTPPIQVVNGSLDRSSSLYTRLHEHRTSRQAGVSGVAHYRLFWMSDDGSLKVFTLVPGTTITGRAAPNATVEVQTTVTVANQSVPYRRVVTANASGQFSVTVPYAGEYTVGDAIVTVPASTGATRTVVHVGDTHSAALAAEAAASTRKRDMCRHLDGHRIT